MPGAANLWPSHGRLAQMVERLVHTEEVIGSMPVSPTREGPGQRILARALCVLDRVGVDVCDGGAHVGAWPSQQL